MVMTSFITGRSGRAHLVVLFEHPFFGSPNFQKASSWRHPVKKSGLHLDHPHLSKPLRTPKRKGSRKNTVHTIVCARGSLSHMSYVIYGTIQPNLPIHQFIFCYSSVEIRQPYVTELLISYFFAHGNRSIFWSCFVATSLTCWHCTTSTSDHSQSCTNFTPNWIISPE